VSVCLFVLLRCARVAHGDTQYTRATTTTRVCATCQSQKRHDHTLQKPCDGENNKQKQTPKNDKKTDSKIGACCEPGRCRCQARADPRTFHLPLRSEASHCHAVMLDPQPTPQLLVSPERWSTAALGRQSCRAAEQSRACRETPCIPVAVTTGNALRCQPSTCQWVAKSRSCCGHVVA
jgi:hypothetical protein